MLLTRLHQNIWKSLQRNPFDVMTKIKNAGAIFLGEYSSEPLGDYFAGPNHVFLLTEQLSSSQH